MRYNYLALIQGGIGPDVWDKELKISAVDFRDAANQATAQADELHGQVVTLEQNETPMDSTKWLIWSHEHKAWWAANSAGYVQQRKDAGRYQYRRACDIVKSANFNLQKHPHEAMVQDA